jgi:hypothetical protein
LNPPRILFALALATCAAARLPGAWAGTPATPCSGPAGLLGLLDRPTVGDSSCIVPPGETVIEAGATAGDLYGARRGGVDTLPNPELRFGLPGDSELVWLPPNFQYQSLDGAPGAPAATMRGFGPTTIGVKHELGDTRHWQWTAEALATLPSGDGTFGSHGLGGALNAIASYDDGPLGVSLMVGVTSQTEPTAAGGQRFQSFNPDLVATWQSTSRLQFYGEVYAQSHSAYLRGWGTDADGGVQYLLTADFEVDLEAGVRVQGDLGGFSRYTGVGFGLQF